MRAPMTTGRTMLRERLKRPAQVEGVALETEMPPYMESFLSHLRLLVGVPFEYLVPDPRLLPDESVRFFYLDRSWTDRLVDGAITLGKIGSREQAHHHAQHAKVASTLDLSERMVRTLQRGRTGFEEARNDASRRPERSAGLITGFVMRSGSVSGWPHMDVRAYSERIAEPFDASAPAAVAKQIRLLRLERLSPGVLFALFDGVPALVTLEEPHHGIQFGVDISANGRSRVVPLRSATGQLLSIGARAVNVDLPRRASRSDVVHVARLRDLLKAKAGVVDDNGQQPIAQSGSASFAIAVLDPPWRQRFEGTEDFGAPPAPPPPVGPVRPKPPFEITHRVRSANLRMSVQQSFILRER
jgi:hypothetical protein